MRKWVSLLLLALLLCLAGFALGEGVPVYVLTNGDGAVLGTAVLADQTGAGLVTAAACVNGSERITAASESETIEVISCRVDNATGLALLTLAHPAEKTPAAFTTEPAVRYVCVLADGTIAEGEIADAAPVTLGGAEGIACRLRTGCLPGAVLVTDSGDVAGIVVAGMNEGTDRYAAVSAERAVGALTAMTWPVRTPAPVIEQIPAGATGTEQPAQTLSAAVWDAYPGYIVVTRTGCTDPVLLHTSNGCVVTTWQWDEGDELFLVLEPGVESELWLTPVDDPYADRYAMAYTTFTAPRVEGFSDFSFRDVSACMTMADADVIYSTTDIVPEQAVTLEGIQAGKSIYLQVTSTYEVDREYHYTLTAVLTAPDGFHHMATTGYLFAPEYMPADSWNWDLTSFLEECASFYEDGCLPEGEYSLTYFIGFSACSEVKFTLGAAQTEPAVTETPAPATGTDLVIDDGMLEVAEGDASLFTESNGLVTVTIPAARAGETWRVWRLDLASGLYGYGDTGDGVIESRIVPGRTYLFTAAVVNDGEDPDINRSTMLGVVTLRERGPFTDYGYTEVETYVTLLDAGEGEATGVMELLPKHEEGVSVSALGAGSRVWLQSVSSYTVDSEITLPSVMAITSGEFCYVLESSFIFSPDYMPRDQWHMDLTGYISHMCQMLNGEDFTPGTYTITYYIAGRQAFSLVLEISGGSIAVIR